MPGEGLLLFACAAGLSAPSRNGHHSTGAIIDPDRTHLDILTGARPLRAFHHEAITICDAAADQPAVANAAIDGNNPLLDLALRIDEFGGCLAPWISRHAALRQKEDFFAYAFLDDGLDIHARHQQSIRIGKERARRDRAGRHGHGRACELQFAGMRIARPVLKKQLDGDRSAIRGDPVFRDSFLQI